jgi:GT2 family glycosyltransferase
VTAGADLDVVILNWQTPELTIACAEAVRRECPTARIVVVDNGSADGSLEKLRAAALPGVTVIGNATTAGFGAGMNLGARAGHQSHVLVLNSDARPVGDSFSKMVARCESDPWIGAVIPRVLDEKRNRLELFPKEPEPWRIAMLMLPGLWRSHRPRFEDTPPDQVNWMASMCATLFSRRAFEAIGGFDERFFLGDEEWDLDRRLKREGWKIVMEPSAEVVHLVAASTPASARPWRSHMGRESHRYFLRKHYGKLWGSVGTAALWISETYLRVRRRSP